MTAALVALVEVVAFAEEENVTKGETAAQASWNKLAPCFSPPTEFRGDLGDYRSVLRFDDGRPVADSAEWQERRQEILRLWHEAMGPWPPLIQEPGIEYLDKEHRENFTQHKVRIQVGPERTTEAYLLVPDGQGPFPAVLTVFYGPEDAAGLTEKAQGKHDFGYQLTRRGFVSLNIGNPGSYYPTQEKAQLQPLSYLAYVAANCWNLLAGLDEVDGERIGVVGHSFGGKWALFASCLYDKFACACWCDPGIVFDESRVNVNYWEPWYLGYEPGKKREPGPPNEERPRMGAYKWLVENGHDLHDLHALMAPRPFFVSGGSEDQPERWKALNHTVAVNQLLGVTDRVGMHNRQGHSLTPEAAEMICRFFEYFLRADQ